MDVVLTAGRTELAQVVERHANAPRKRDELRGKVVINLSLQTANTLLHDGQLWKRCGPERIVGETAELLDDARHEDAEFIVHAGYASQRGLEEGGEPGDRLGPILAAAAEAERLVLGSGRPACVVRLGYLYGPESRDLRLYRRAFRMARPYWAGSGQRHNFLHTDDAARALLGAAHQRPAGRVLYATDDEPASFGAFMDYFARRIGNPLPLHLPRISRRVSHFVVAEEHMQMCELGVTGVPAPRPRGFTPAYRDYQAGIDAVLATWSAHTTTT